MDDKTNEYKHYTRYTSVASADLNWEKADHKQIPIEDQVFIDPWELENNDAQINRATEVYSSIRADDESAKQDGAERNPDHRMNIPDTADFSSHGNWETSPYDSEVTNGEEWENFFLQDTERTNDFTVEDPLFFIDGDFGLYDFDTEAQQPLWDLETDKGDLSPRKAKKKAAIIIHKLGLQSKREQDEALYFLANLFELRPHPMTFRAIYTAIEGLDLDILKAMVELRDIWMYRSGWWYYRYRGRICHMQQQQGEVALTWALARRVCLARREYPPEMMIDDEWFDEWLATPPGTPGFVSFPAFIDAKIKIQPLCDGLNMMQVYREESGSLVDNYGWWHQLPDALELGAIHQRALQTSF